MNKLLYYLILVATSVFAMTPDVCELVFSITRHWRQSQKETNIEEQEPNILPPVLCGL